MVKGKFLGTSDPLGCINGKVYEIIGLDHGYIRVIDELEDDYLYPPTDFEIVEGSIAELKERGDKN
jgi:hypothetical protein